MIRINPKFINLLYLVFLVGCGSNTATSPPVNKQETVKNEVQTAINYDYSVVAERHNKIVENFDIVLSIKNQSDIEKALREIKTKICTKDCNINAFTDAKYARYMIEMQNNELLKKKYYVQVADNYIAQLEFEAGGLFFSYPYRDWYYKELGGKHKKPD